MPGHTSLRALAHPLRWQLIDLLDSTGQATATQCAEALGETVASCAYHLSILGKYGYARQVPGHAGREKPWELTDIPQNLSSAGSDPASAQERDHLADRGGAERDLGGHQGSGPEVRRPGPVPPPGRGA